MLFNSMVFLIFAAGFYALWPIMRRAASSRWLFMVVASLVFYGWWDWRFCLLIAASGLLDYAAALGMVRRPELRRVLLALSILGNVGTLCVFKYLPFLCANLNALGQGLGLGAGIPLLQLTLPVGISFYTFQSMSYTLDVYRGELQPTRNVLHFFAYLAMFPQLVAGPIVRARDLLPQLRHGRPTTESQRWCGLQRIAGGYFKKVVLADNLAPAVNLAFAASVPLESGAYWWVITLLFAAQIYFDFSGYSDIARGLASWMGYDFPENFNHPYVSCGLRDFWSRWHISLSTWFRDYLYIPLGGSRGSGWQAHRNMWIVMLISGLWHGAAWGFVVWGAIHAALLSIERISGWPARLARLPGGRTLAIVLTLLQVCVAWVFFRATSIEQAWHILALMFNPGKWNVAAVGGISAVALLMLLAAVVVELAGWIRLDRRVWSGGSVLPWRPALLACLLSLCVYLRGPGSAFIYFQF